MTQLGQPLPPGTGIGSHALLHNGLASHAQEWQREMARAQARAWLHASMPAPGGDPRARPDGNVPGGGHPLSVPLGASPVLLPDGPQPAGAMLSTSVAAAGPSSLASSSAAALPAPDACHGRGPAVALRPASTPGLEPAPGADDIPRGQRSARDVRVPDPRHVHVHVEDGGDGVRVWLGLAGDQGSIAPRAASVLAELRRVLGAQSHRLVAVVCNGRLLEPIHPPHSTPPEDAPWPLDP